MPERVPAPDAARAQLAALVDAARTGAIPTGGRRSRLFDTLRRMPLTPGAREASVLILFGVLDDVPAAHVPAPSNPRAAISRDLDVLLLARATTLRSHPGQIAFPGGRVDPGDRDAPAAALREAREETGLDPSGVEVLGELPRVPLDHSGHIVTPVLGWWREPSPVRVVDVAESADVFRAPVADLLNPANRGTTVLTRGGETWRGPGFLLPGERQHLVWGFTAMLLDGVFEQLGWTEPWDQEREILLPDPDSQTLS